MWRSRGSSRNKKCPFASGKISADQIDHLNVQFLGKYLTTETWKIVPSRITGVSKKYQKKLAEAIKRARFLALIPYTDRH